MAEEDPETTNSGESEARGQPRFADDFVLDARDLGLVDHVLSTARSVRRKLDFERPVPDGLLCDAIDVATQAPTGLIGEAWRFLILKDPERKAAVAALYRETLLKIFEARAMPMKATHQALMDRLHEMPALVFVCAPAPPSDGDAQLGYYGSILPAAWSLMLALRARGLGCTWTSLLAGRQRELGALLALPADVVQLVMLPVAFTKGAKLRPAERMASSEVAYLDRWGAAVTALNPDAANNN